MSATITLGLSDYDEMRRKQTDLEFKVSTLETTLEQARLSAGEADNRGLATALGHAIKIVQFAIAHLHPLTVRGWPYEDLRQLGLMLKDLPGIDPAVREVAYGDWANLLASEMERWEKARAEGREQEMLQEENAARSIGHGLVGQILGDKLDSTPSGDA